MFAVRRQARCQLAAVLSAASPSSVAGPSTRRLLQRDGYAKSAMATMHRARPFSSSVSLRADGNETDKSEATGGAQPTDNAKAKEADSVEAAKPEGAEKNSDEAMDPESNRATQIDSDAAVEAERLEASQTDSAENSGEADLPATDSTLGADTAHMAQSDQSSGRQERPARRRKGSQAITIDQESFPSILREPHPLLDTYSTVVNPPERDFPYPSSVTFFNSDNLFPPSPPTAANRALSSQGSDAGDEVDDAAQLAALTPLSKQDIRDLQKHLILVRRVVKMTGKGKMKRMAALSIAGNSRGLVGMGEGKDDNASRAVGKSFQAAVKNMDYVERYNDHTIPTELKGKWSSTEVTLRPRPQGFGLQVPPVIHRIARACGITDLSASILGSTNPFNVAQATLQLLWGGSAPLGLGDGIGGSMRRRDRGVGLRTVRDVELLRGRRLREIQWPNRTASPRR